jgi:hypothetical protein
MLCRSLKMKEFLFFLLVLGALVIGAVAGYFYEMRHSTATQVFLETSNTYTTLRDLRSGDTNAVFEALEDNLDMNVISLRALLDEYPHAEHANNYTNLLRRIAEYRSAHPYRNSNSNFDEMVTDALKSVSKTNR